MGKWTTQARLALSQRNYTQAGDFFKLDGNYRSAINAYIKGRNYGQAATLYENLGKAGKAEKLLLKHGSPEERAEFYLRTNNLEMAVDVYMGHGMHYEAAELLERLNQLPRAAALYESLNFDERAGMLYGKCKNFDKAIEMFTKVVAKLDMTLPQAKAKAHKYNLWIANFHIGSKRFLKAGEIFENAQQIEKAVKCYVKGGDPVRAAHILLKMRNFDEAATILAGVHSLESRILQGKIAIEHGDYDHALEMLKETDEHQLLSDIYEKLGRFQDAAYLLEKVGNLQSAAKMYANGQEYHRAAILYEQNGCYGEAAQNYEAQQKWGHAAKLYHLSKNRYKAGFCLFKFERLDDALAQMQMLSEEDPNYIKGRHIMAEIFYRQGVFSVARQLYEELLDEAVLDDNTMLSFYYLARCFEEEDHALDAKRIYERIVARRFNFGDVADRLRRLHSQQQTINQTGNVTLTREINSPSDLSIGELIDGRFKVVDIIGKGGMGAIFKVKDMELSRNIALKMLTHKRADFEELKVELLIARDLTHPYIIKVFDVGSWNGMGYFTMEAVEGPPLKTYIHNSESDSLEDKLRLLVKICEGLKHAHDQNVVHRDIKPQNIMIGSDGNPKILDFGIARKTNHDTQGKAISGSPKYMAPEQIQNTRSDVRTDIYAMGIIIFYMFTLKEPFLAKTPQAVMRMHLHTPLPDPMGLNPDMPYWLCEIIQKCCRKSMDMRFNHMGELVDELKLNLMDF